MIPLQIPRTPNVFGFTSGFGGSVTQLTDKSTAVTIDKLCGQIVTHNASLAAGAEVSFTVNNAFVEAGDIPVIAIASGATTDTYVHSVQAVAAGSFQILLSNVSTTNRATAITFNFAIIKGAAA